MTAPLRRVLMVTPVWPPLGAIGVRRVVRLARLLPQYGWQPVVLTDTPTGSGKAKPPLLDPTLVPPPVEVHHAPAWMPGARARRALVAALGGRLGHFAHQLTDGLLLPDHYPEWAWAAVRAARKVAPVDAVWSTGTPFGAFVAAAAVAQALRRPLVLDYRDPWSQAGNPSRNPLRWPPAVHAALEARLLARAAGVAYVNAEMRDRNATAFGEGPHWAVIPNGFDLDELADVPPWPASDRPTLLHAGNCYRGRSFVPVLKALAAGFGPGEKGLQVEAFGALDPEGAALATRLDLAGRFAVHGRVSAAEIGQRLKGATALLLIGDAVHSHALTGKIFDYIAAGRPILGVGPAGAPVGQLIEAAGLGRWVDATDEAAVVAGLRAAEAGTLPFAPRPEVLHPYSAAAMAERTAHLLNDVVGVDTAAATPHAEPGRPAPPTALEG